LHDNGGAANHRLEAGTMQIITVDSEFCAKLGSATSQTVLCDDSGRVLGFFSPEPDKPKLSDLQLDSPRSLEEMKALAKTQRTGKPLQEILTRLGY
jgi:hypothetical protein